MDTVTESHMAVSMAALGGIVILHSNAASSDQASMVRSVKARRVPLLSAPVFMSRGDRILHNDDVFDHGANPYFLVTESGSPSSKLLGYMASRDWVKLANKEVKIYDYMVSCKDMVLPWSSDLGKIEEFMADKGWDVVATVRDDEVVDVVGKEDVESINEVDLRFFRFTGAESINEENIPIEEVLENMRCSKEGLSSEAAEERLAIFGHNKLKEKQGKPPDWQDFAVIVTYCFCIRYTNMFRFVFRVVLTASVMVIQ